MRIDWCVRLIIKTIGMKQNLLFSFLLLSFFAGAQDHYLVPRLTYSTGMGAQEGRFESFGISLQYESYSKTDKRLGYIITGETHMAGSETKRIDLNFGGSNGYTNVDYRSSMYKAMAGGIVVPFNGKFISPYFSMQAGVMMYHTKMYINDPDDNDYCEPVEARNVKASFSAIAAAESGIKVRVSNKRGRPVFAQAGVGYTVGTKASYIKLGDDNSYENTQAYTSKFRMSNGDTHTHQIGTLHRTNTSQLAFNVGVSFVFD